MYKFLHYNKIKTPQMKLFQKIFFFLESEEHTTGVVTQSQKI